MKIIKLFLTAFCVIISTSPVLALQFMPIESHAAYSSDSEYLFVMKNPDGWMGWYEEYPQSGLYRNDGETEPLWTVDWFCPKVYLSKDCSRLAA